jgi:predicted lipase
MDSKYTKIEIDEKTKEINVYDIDLNDIKIELTDNIELNDIKIEINANANRDASYISQYSTTELIKKCLQYTSDSYGSNPNTTLTHKKFEKNIFSRVDLYYEIKEEQNLFIAIRGTVTMYDVMNDINFIQERMELDADVPEIKVHKGFHQDFKDIKPFLSTLINENPNIKNIYFTGHSRGSSVSTLSALYIKTIYPHLNIYNIGFGCPRLGCENFANYYNKLLRETTYLFREDLDIVTKLPIYGYYDIMNQYVIKDKKIDSMYDYHDSVIEIIESGIEHHRLYNYMNCNYINPNFFPL